MVVSSFLVTSEPNHFDSVRQQLSDTSGVEITKTEGCKFAVVLDTESTSHATDICKDIRSWPGVVGLAMVSHFFEDEAQKHGD
jgi:nitrate reductase NapAB chaperone NapD